MTTAVRPVGAVSRAVSPVAVPDHIGRVAQNTSLAQGAVLRRRDGSRPTTVSFLGATCVGMMGFRNRAGEWVMMIADADGDWREVKGLQE